MTTRTWKGWAIRLADGSLMTRYTDDSPFIEVSQKYARILLRCARRGDDDMEQIGKREGRVVRVTIQWLA